MDFSELKAQIKEIAEIAAGVPEKFKDRTFDALLNHLLAQPGTEKPSKQLMSQPEVDKVDPEEAGASKHNGQLPLTSSIRVLMRKTGLTEEDLGKVIMIEGGEIYFIKEPQTKKAAQGQFEWALLMTLKNGFLKNTLATDAEELRSICKEKGFYDSNFPTYLKNGKFTSTFKGTLERMGDPQSLTNDGMDALGTLIRELAQ